MKKRRPRKPERMNHKTEVVLCPSWLDEEVLIEDSRGQWYKSQVTKYILDKDDPVFGNAQPFKTRLIKMQKGWKPGDVE